MFLWSAAALVICMKLPLLAFPEGLLKCGVLVELNASARNSTFSLSRGVKLRNSPKFRLTTPGPRRMVRPVLRSEPL
jgi:hypothetical protein